MVKVSDQAAASSAIETDAARTVYSVEEVSIDVGRLKGQTVTVRGYLTGFGPIMVLTHSQNSNRYEDPALLVTHTELRSEILSGSEYIDLKHYFESIGCVEQFAEVVGEIGLVAEQRQSGIIRIDSVRTFNDGTFGDSGVSCFPG